MTYEISDCEQISATEICSAMNDAFSDYVVPLTMSNEQFSDFQRQRGFSARHSFVARKDGRIAGFWLSSPPNARYGGRAYTLSVGTHPDDRRQGLSRTLLATVSKSLRANGATGMQLEVISSNDKAVNAYEGFGYSCNRKLRICKLPKAGLDIGGTGEWTVEALSIDDLPEDEESYFDTAPTPQNSREALIGLSPSVAVAGIRSGDGLLGWGAIYEDGAVAQIAVHKNHRRRGLGQALLGALAQKVAASELTFVNVDEAAEGVNAFLNRAGARDVLQQFEMHLTF